MPFKIGQQLTPSEVYYAAVGLFLSKGYECTHTVESDIPGVPEFGRVFTKGGVTHVLYFPGKDNNEPMSASQTTLPLSDVITGVTKYFDDKKIPMAGINKHMVVCENNNLVLFFKRHHFVYVTQRTMSSYNLYDSKSKKTARLTYPLHDLKNILFPAFAGGFGCASLSTQYAGIQKGNWECGYYTLLSLEMCMNGGYVKNLPENIDDAILESIEGMHTLGFKHCHPAQPEGDDEHPDISDAEINRVFDTDAIAAESPKPAAPSFWQRHRKTKYALTGLAIGLGVLAIGVALAFAWPVVLPAVGGFIAAHMAIGALTTATVGWLGLAAAGVAVTAVTTGVSMFAKWVKDKVSPKPMPVVAAPAEAVKPRSRRSSTATTTSTLSSMGTSTQELGDHLDAQVLKGNLTDSVVESAHPAEGDRLSMSGQRHQVETLPSPEEAESDSDSDDDFVNIPRKQRI